MGRGRPKRLRVRLRSADREALVRDLGSSLSERGVFLASEQLLEVGTPVHVDLRFVDGEPALEGHGVVARVEADPSGMHLELDWVPACRPVLYWVIARATEPSWDVHVQVPASAPAAEVPPKVEADTGDLAAALDGLLEDEPAREPEVSALGGDWGGMVARAPEAPSDDLELSFEQPVEEDGSPSEDLLPLEDSTPSLDLPSSDDLDDVEPILLEDVVEEPPEVPEPEPTNGPRTQYAFSTGSRDELGPGPAPTDALRSADVTPPPLAPATPTEPREDGEVTPLARIELVRRSNSVVGEVAPPPEVFSRVPASAIPSKRHRPELAPPSRRALGIDPGDQTTRVAVVERAHARILPSRRGAPGVPSAVFIDTSGKTIVGEPATRRLPWHPDSGLHGTKRLLGRFFCAPRVASLKARLPCRLGAAEEDEVALSIGPHFISLEEIEALVLKEAKAAATFALQDELNRVVLTCPASFGIRQRRALAMSGRLAGLHVDRVVSSPLAVVLGQLKAGALGQGRYLVYELGARFFDVSIVQVDGHSARILATQGDPELGGAELDQALADLVLEEMEKIQGVVPATRTGLLDVIDAAELGKCNLSVDSVTRIAVEHPETDGVPAFALEVEVTRAEAERRFLSAIERTLSLTREVLASAGLRSGDVDGVLAAGGATRMPIVRQRLSAMFPGRWLELDPETAAVTGAAWAAADFESTAPFALHERLPAAIVARPRREAPRTVLPEGAMLPASSHFVHQVDGKADLHVFLFQGGHGDLERDEPLAHLVIEPERLPELPWRVCIEVELDSSGNLSFEARDEVSGEQVGLREVQELSRELLLAHYGHVGGTSPTPPHGLYRRLLDALKADGRYT